MARGLLLRPRDMRRLLCVLAAGFALAACARPSSRATACNPNGNPIDGALCPEFDAAGYQPHAAPAEELCTRLSIDMLGVRPTADQVKACAARPYGEVVRDWQGSVGYREWQRRRWADRFLYSDELVDVALIKNLDGLVDELYRGWINYGRFGEMALSDPAFVGRNLYYGQPTLVADAAFQVFLGRDATIPEENDLSHLWTPWQGGFYPPETNAGAGVSDVPANVYGNVPNVDPTVCDRDPESCTSTLLGYAFVDLHANGRKQPVKATDLTPEDIEALRAPGRLFVSLPIYWEAEVDDVVKKYLGYDLDTMKPEVRDALVRDFRHNGGDVVMLERAVLESWAYRQSAAPGDGKVAMAGELGRPAAVATKPYAWGPTKPILPETFLKSIGQVTGTDPGDCDWRYPSLPDWYYPGNAQLDAELGDDVRFRKLPTGGYDPAFRDAAAAMGGCPGTFDTGSFDGVLGARRRTTQLGLMQAVAQDGSLVQACLLGSAPLLVGRPGSEVDRDAAIRATVRRVIGVLDSREPTATEVDEIAADAEAGCPGCSVETIGRDLCAGLGGGLETIFY